MAGTTGGLKAWLESLYNGASRRAVAFRYALLTLDIVTIAYFLVLSALEARPGVILAADIVIAVALIADFSARLLIAPRRLRFALDPVSLADLVVIGTLLAAPLFGNLGFLRVLRTLRLLRSYHVLRELRARYRFFARNEAVIGAVVNLAVFIFVVAAVVYVMQVHRNPQIANYVDALYFTVATLTTTGFGDITLAGSSGRLLAILIMVVGVALFLRLIRAIFRPAKVEHRCPDCGLKQHDPDAVHCKHCGKVLNIETEGAG